METKRIEEILSKIKDVKIAVYGDFCLDSYWIMDPQGSEISVETGLKAQAVKGQNYTLGGASNIVANMAALQPAKIQVIGVVGDDIFGREIRRQFEALNVDTDTLTIQKEDFDTIVFAKRYFDDKEEPRIDFGFFNKRSKKTDQTIIENLKKALQDYDVIIFNQQVPNSINNEEFITQANKLFEKFGEKMVLFDSRNYGDKFTKVCRKANEVEITQLNGVNAEPGDLIALEDVKKYARKLYDKSKKPLFVTRGSRGILTVDKNGLYETAGVQVLKKIDTVGAGDTTISALGLALAAGAEPNEAAEFANIAAAVTVQKLFQTGTANAEEILKIGKDTDYIYQPELAEDIRQAQYIKNTNIEICCDKKTLDLGHIKHVVFDHDGTISTLREGWEKIMLPVMIKAILGDKYETADEKLYHKVRNQSLDYIDKSTGIQTIIQMEALVEMVKEFGAVPKENVLDKLGYKKIYNDALMEMVNERIKKFQLGQLDISDYTVKGAVDLLKLLHGKGIKLYLASGTDRDDVVNEVKILGYADYFEGKIYGSIGDVSKYSKKMVVDKIINDNNLKGSELAIFGDGPVEMRECRKKNGIAIGLASDEVRRHGLNIEKRTRLIKSGASFIIPDFSQLKNLEKLLFCPKEIL